MNTEQTDATLALLVSQGFSPTILTRFWAKVEKGQEPNGCWLWKGGKTVLGYGKIVKFNRSTDYVHRVSWLIHHGIPAEGMSIIHGCQNPLCVNPEHLFTARRNPFGETRKPSDPFPRFSKNVSRNPDTFCWEWTGTLHYNGYGKFSTPFCHEAHRFSYMAFIGPIPEGLEIHHRCRNRRCVNPFHLEPVTHQVNCATDFKREFCQNGHALIPENCYQQIRNGRIHRTCKICTLARSKAKWLAAKSA